MAPQKGLGKHFEGNSEYCSIYFEKARCGERPSLMAFVYRFTVRSTARHSGRLTIFANSLICSSAVGLDWTTAAMAKTGNRIKEKKRSIFQGVKEIIIKVEQNRVAIYISLASSVMPLAKVKLFQLLVKRLGCLAIP